MSDDNPFLESLIRTTVWPLLQAIEASLTIFRETIAQLEAAEAAPTSPAGSSMPGPHPGILMQLAPAASSPDDWDFAAHSVLATDSRWDISGHVTIEPIPLQRGDIWANPGDIRAALVSNRLLVQPSADGISYEVGTWALLGGPRANDAVSLGFTFDASDTVITADQMIFAFTQSMAGDIDFNNGLAISLIQDAPDHWVVFVGIVEAGLGSVLFATSFSQFDPPFQAASIERHLGALRCWVGPDLSNLHRLGPDHPTLIVPDRTSFLLSCDGKPNRTFGLIAFRRTDSSTF